MQLKYSAFFVTLLGFSFGHAQGIITTVAGTGSQGFSGDGGPAGAARIALPAGLAFDSAGNLYFADTGNVRLRAINTSGVVRTVAGDGTVQLSQYGVIGDGGPATTAGFAQAASPYLQGVAVDKSGNIYISDTGNMRIRKITPTGTISTFAGSGFQFPGDGSPATSAVLLTPTGLATDSAGNVYIVDSSAGRIHKVDTSGIITTIAGNGTAGFTGDGVSAAGSPLNAPVGVAVDAKGNVYFSEVGNALINNGPRVRKVDSAGILTTVAGNGTAGFSGDGGLATNAQLAFGMQGLAVDKVGNLYISDYGNSRIRRVDPLGIITTVAGIGQANSSTNGDGGPAANALVQPAGLAVDASGNLFIADYSSSRIRKIIFGLAAPPLSLSTSNLVFSASVNATPASQVLTVTSTAPTPLSFSVATKTTSGGPWLVAGSSGVTPQGIQVSIQSGLPVGTYNGTISITPFTPGYAPVTVAVTLTITANVPVVPTVSPNGLVNSASFRPGFVSNSLLTILGTNLASITDNWNQSILSGFLPVSLDGVTVTFNGKAAYLAYISPTQINLLTPDFAVPNLDTPSVTVLVNNNGSSGPAYTAPASLYGPAFFPWPNNQVVATRQDFSYAAKPGTFANLATVAAKPGDVIILWGTGFGPTTPATLAGSVVPSDRTYATTASPVVTIGNVSVAVYGAALAPGYAGLYQVAIQIPDTITDGDWPVVATIGGATSPTGLILSVKK